MAKQKPPYSEFARVYDHMGADSHSVNMVHYCYEIFQKFRIHPSSGLDLCCGTGSAVKEFFQHGLSMSGLDASPHMLAAAAKKLRGRNIPLYQKRLPRFRILDNSSGLTRIFDLVVSFYDSLNYLKTEAQLRQTFHSVHRHLEDSGWFIFDMNTAEALKVIWEGETWGDAWDDIAWVWRSKYDPETRSSDLLATFFVRRGRLWERFDETHTEYAYSNTTIKKLLRETGFKVRGFYKCFLFERPDRKTYRICVVAQKK